MKPRRAPVEIKDLAHGYAANGESQYSRVRARGSAPRFSISGGAPAPRGVNRTTAKLIEFERGRLRHLEAELRIEDKPRRREKIEHDIDIKTAFLARLLTNS